MNSEWLAPETIKDNRRATANREWLAPETEKREMTEIKKGEYWQSADDIVSEPGGGNKIICKVAKVSDEEIEYALADNPQVMFHLPRDVFETMYDTKVNLQAFSRSG